MSDGKDEFGTEYETNSHRSHLAAYILIAGLVAELFIAIFWYHGTETLAEMVAILLIVGGVWGEVHFGNRARIAGDKELAKSKAHALEAQLELERLKQKVGPRVLSRDEFLAEISDKPRASTELLFVKDDPDSFSLAHQIFNLLMTAGWTCIPPRPIRPDEGIAPEHAPAALSIGGQPAGVSITCRKIPDSPNEAVPVNTLATAFLKTLGAVAIGLDEGLIPGTLRVIVAPRP